MASSVKVVDKLPQFTKQLHELLDDALRETSLDILIKSRDTAPFRKGGLRSDSYNDQVAQLHWRVSYNKEYARFQEFGGDGNRVVRNYTTPGTGAAYLKTAGNNGVDNLKRNIKKHGLRARV
jgi:hypothetical protein